MTQAENMIDTIMSVDELCISFHQGQQDIHVVKDVSFSIAPCETLALVGESGSGKSLTAHAIMGLLPYPLAFHPKGEIHFDDKDLLSLPKAAMRDIRGNEIGMIFQEPMSALNPLHTIEKQIGEVLKLHKKYNKQAIRDKVLDLLKQVQIKDAEDKLKSYPHQLSGGQRQRVMIAMALANRPKLLIADEPTTALDVTVQKDILDLLKSLQAQYQMSILLITHDLGTVRYMAERVMVMHQGRIIEQAPTQQLFEQPQNDYTRLLINSEPSGNAVSLDKPIADLVPLMRTQNLRVSFAKDKPLIGRSKSFFHALAGVDISIPRGTTLGIVGESGSGKSTLAYAMLRLLDSTGDIELDGQDIAQLNEKKLRPLRNKMQIIFQDPFASLSPRMTVQEIISEGLDLHFPLERKQTEVKVIAMMEEVGLDPDTRHRYPHEFSGGQRQRIAIARALILNPQVLFLDEPTSALDKAVQAQVIDLLRRLQADRNLSYIFISHDIHVIRTLSHQIAVMKAGEIIEFGDSQTLLSKPEHVYTQTLLSATLDYLPTRTIEHEQ